MAEEPKREQAEARLADELAHIPEEPFLPVERALVIGSLVLGVLLLGLLWWISSTQFPAP
jgi:hypothetical protein